MMETVIPPAAAKEEAADTDEGMSFCYFQHWLVGPVASVCTLEGKPAVQT